MHRLVLLLALLGAPLVSLAQTDPALVAYWPLTSAPAVEVLDLSGHDNHGAVRGTPVWNAEGMQLDGTSSYLEVPDTTDTLDGMTTLTIAVWVKTTSTKADMAIISKFGSGNAGYGDGGSYALRMTNGRILGSVSGTGYSSVVNSFNERLSTQKVNDGNWHHIVMTFHGDYPWLYIDGTPDMGTIAGAWDIPSILATGTWVGLGAESRKGRAYYAGMLRDARIYTRALTLAEIRELFAATGGAAFPPWDSVPPTAPSLLEATANSPSSVTVSWQPSGDNTGVVGYQILRDGWPRFYTAQTTWTEEGLRAGTPYVYTVQGYDRDENFSSPAQVTVTTHAAGQRVLRVGPTRPLTTPQQAAAQAQDGDIVEIDPGTYADSRVVWTKHNLTVRGAPGGERPRMERKGDGWRVQGNYFTMEHIALMGLHDAGVKPYGDGLYAVNTIGVTIRDCVIADWGNGVRTSANGESDVLIEYSELARNGNDGLNHNAYIGHVRSLTWQYTWSHDAVNKGHLAKSRAQYNYFYYNKFDDGRDGNYAGFAMDFSNGGLVYAIGNTCYLPQEAAFSGSSACLGFAPEGLSNRKQELYVANNTFVHERVFVNPVFISVRGRPEAAYFNNLFVTHSPKAPRYILANPERIDDKRGQQIELPLPTSNLATPTPGFVDGAAGDFRLTPSSVAIDAGMHPGVAMMPRWQYVHPMRREERPEHAQVDIGAYEYAPTATPPLVGTITISTAVLQGDPQEDPRGTPPLVGTITQTTTTLVP